MRKFANLETIQERHEAQKAGLSIESYRKKLKDERVRQYEIDKAWAAAHKDGKNVRTEVFHNKDAKPLAAKPKKKSNKERKLNQAPEMRTVHDAQKQYWDGTGWVKLETKEPVHV